MVVTRALQLPISLSFSINLKERKETKQATFDTVFAMNKGPTKELL